MATYIIGDVQGCYQELMQLLDLINYDAARDRLGFVGDVVNRGPDSLAVLRFLRTLHNPIVVLGNHDLYLLILGYQLMPMDSVPHTLTQLIEAPDCAILLDWLRHRPLMIEDAEHQAVFVHAGLPPQWSIEEGRRHACAVSAQLTGVHFKAYLAALFGDTPANWSEALTGQDRWRYITNAFTRMRFCTRQGELDFRKLHPNQNNSTVFRPWYEWRDFKKDHRAIYFGHWAALRGECPAAHCHSLDTGCAWGHALTAVRLEDQRRFQVPAIAA